MSAPRKQKKIISFKEDFESKSFQINAYVVNATENFIDFSVQVWYDGQEKPQEKDMVQLAEISIKGKNSQFTGAELSAQTLIEFSSSILMSLLDKWGKEKAQEFKATISIPHSLGSSFGMPQKCLNDQNSDYLKGIGDLPETYEELTKIMLNSSRSEGILLFTKWIKTHGAYYEARACEVAGEMRTKRINAEKKARGDAIEPKRSVSIRRMKGIPYLVENTAGSSSRLLGRRLPEDYDKTQVSISEEAEALIGR